MRSSRHIRVWLLAPWSLLLLPSGSPQAQTACYVCDEVVELDNVLASCLLKDFDRHLMQIRQSSEQYSSVDLTACVGSDGSENRGIIAMPVPGTPKAPSAAAPLRTVYVMDEKSLLCLQKLITPLTGKLSPVRLFDLTQECAP